MEQQEPKFSISETFSKSKQYIETQMELAKLRLVSKASRVVGSLIVDISKVLLILLIVFFLSMALGFYLGEVLESNALGFLVTGGIFLLVVLLIRALEPKIETLFVNFTIKKVMSKWIDDEDDEDDEEQEETSADRDNDTVENGSDPVPDDQDQTNDREDGREEQPRV